MRHYLFFFLFLTGLASAEILEVKFAPAERTETVSGNLIVVVSDKQFQPRGPGILNVWQQRVAVVQDLRLQFGETVEVDVGNLGSGRFMAAYFDENRDFMGTCFPGPGEYYSSKLLKSSGEQYLKLALDTQRQAPSLPRVSWLKEQSFISSTLLDAGFDRKQATFRFLIGLPPGYWQTERTYPVLFVSHGFSGDRWVNLKRYQMWRKMMEEKPMIIVSMDSNSRFGHHLFLNSEANGPRFEVLTKELVPYIDNYFRTNGKRVIYGQSSGGWTAVSVLQKAPHLFAGAVATGPDPLVLDDWWFGRSGNIFQRLDGSERMLAPDHDLSMRSMVSTEVQTDSFGQYSAFLACFSPYRPERDGLPFLSPFHADSGEVDPELWKIWKQKEIGSWVQAHPAKAKEVFSHKLVLFVGTNDEFGLRETTHRFSQILGELGIPHLYKEIPGAGHTNYLERPAFVEECWDTFYHLAHGRRDG